MKIGITGTGSYIPSVVTDNDDFLNHEFLGVDGSSFEQENTVIIEKFQAITGIASRRYAKPELKTSDIGFLAAEEAISNAGIDKEELDYIIFAHNFGDLTPGKIQGDTLPSLASRVKHLLRIKNPKCVAYDLIFGCPGWIEGVIQAKAFIQSGLAKKCLVIGGETLSRVIDRHDRDSMIFSDGAGATILEANPSSGEILAHASATYANDEAYYLYFDKTNSSKGCTNTRYIKMQGRKIYEFACINVPKAMAECLDESGVNIDDVKKIFIHQANEKMDEAIIKRFYKIYGKKVPDHIMPMSIHKLGNSSVATVPTLLNLVEKGELPEHKLEKGDVIMFASVGAGMNINAVVYRY
ncbi:3-oxoacyl-ACP synthase III family protein [Flagellimonas zhangzhouensis]|uniref:3-oxoacyl-[acyl-carrier-protein] synthase-3 n=1 Tax=Flagellimonas zhangzhouensis TaxID=1073328 RepID=A0A1H2Q385_9FLAO|nr:ketoacyl-ACP synthase III [Allomuricauda zhangzhouensis]SDQ47564.1 3-oxoacyl-[acyl-carrier-protein] synthase-3 [Allomuricauda zhangzhouensis]SDW01637.1 3-oxoacyl-[acyl-carrier-protein] synthase-3 [Allomuricauda zhangzhouensis]